MREKTRGDFGKLSGKKREEMSVFSQQVTRLRGELEFGREGGCSGSLSGTEERGVVAKTELNEMQKGERYNHLA